MLQLCGNEEPVEQHKIRVRMLHGKKNECLTDVGNRRAEHLIHPRQYFHDIAGLFIFTDQFHDNVVAN